MDMKNIEFTDKNSVKIKSQDKTEKLPKIRFREFDNDLNFVLLEDISLFYKGKGISKNQITHDGIECIRYGELYTKYGEIIKDVLSKTNLNKKELVLSESNDILIPCSGETAIDLATASCVLKENVAIGGDITIIKTNQYAPFITYYINNKRTEIAKYAQGVSIVHLYSKDFKKLSLMIPSINEQKRIVDFISLLDEKITLMQKTLFLYQKHLQSLRFKLMHNNVNNNFFKLKEVCKINKGKQLNKSDMVENGEYYVLNGGKKPSGFTNSWNVKENTITISEGGNSCGFVSFNTEKFYCGGHCYYLELNNCNVNLEYLFNYLKSIETKIMKLRVGSGLPNIQKGDIKNISLNMPSISKQEQISKILSSYISQINLKEQELDFLNDFKKGLLQKMFI